MLIVVCDVADSRLKDLRRVAVVKDDDADGDRDRRRSPNQKTGLG